MVAAIYWVSELTDVRLAFMPRPRGHDWLADEISSLRDAGLARLVSLIEPHEAKELGLEQEPVLCLSKGIAFTSFPIRDRDVPSSAKDVASLVESIVASLRRGEPVAIHCRVGIGRSGLITACVLLHLGIDEAEIFPMLSRARGLSVPDTVAQMHWLRSYAQQRRAGRFGD